MSLLRKSRIAAAVAAIASAAGLLVSGGTAGAQATMPGLAGAVLPNPGPLLAAPRSLAAAEKEIRAVLAQAGKPKTALVGTVRLLVNAGVTIVNGGSTVYRGRGGGPPLFMQAGQVEALARELPGTPVPLSTLLRTYAAATAATPKVAKVATAAFYGKNFAKEISGASDADEFLWAAVLVDSDTSARGLLASLNGAGRPADALIPLQVQFLSMRLESDALGIAAGYAGKGHGAQAVTPAYLSAAKVPCDIDYVPGSFFEGLSTAYNSGITAMLKGAGLASTAVKYGIVMSMASIAASVANLALMFWMLNVTTTEKPDPIVRTKSTTEDGGKAQLDGKFSFDTGNLQWMSCVRTILNFAGLDASVASPDIKGAQITWSVNGGDPATVEPATTLTGDGDANAGVASTTLTGKRQPMDLGQPIKFTRSIGITEAVNPLVSRSASDMAAHIVITVLQAVIGGPWGIAAALVQTAVDAAQRFGLLRRSTEVTMTDWHQFPTSFSASFTFNDPDVYGYAGLQLSSAGTITLPRTDLDQQDGSSGFHWYSSLQGNVNYSYPNWGCTGTTAVKGGVAPIIGVNSSPPGYGGFFISINFPVSTTSSCIGGQIVDNLGGQSASMWKAGMTSSTVVIYTESGSGSAVGTMTFHWYYT